MSRVTIESGRNEFVRMPTPCDFRNRIGVDDDVCRYFSATRTAFAREQLADLWDMARVRCPPNSSSASMRHRGCGSVVACVLQRGLDRFNAHARNRFDEHAGVMWSAARLPRSRSGAAVRQFRTPEKSRWPNLIREFTPCPISLVERIALLAWMFRTDGIDRNLRPAH
jgi:hypothetical protein